MRSRVETSVEASLIASVAVGPSARWLSAACATPSINAACKRTVAALRRRVYDGDPLRLWEQVWVVCRVEVLS